MQYKATQHQLNHIIDLIGRNFLLYGPVKFGDKVILSRVSSPDQIVWNHKRTIMPLKKILYPNGREIDKSENNKIAIVGLPLCDTAALSLLLKQFSKSSLMPDRNQLLIIASSCTPDDHCFCNQYELSKLYDYDLYVLINDNEIIIESKSYRGSSLAAKTGLIRSKATFAINPGAKAKKFDLDKTSALINDKNRTQKFWQGIANNCFGCGACSTVCPLCFCFRQDFKSMPDGSYKKCLNWDSCFSGDFSQIQNGFDLRPANVDRLYNWYHHKFVRGPRELGHPLCVGCGRCITACPAHLNINSIIHSLNNKYE